MQVGPRRTGSRLTPPAPRAHLSPIAPLALFWALAALCAGSLLLASVIPLPTTAHGSGGDQGSGKKPAPAQTPPVRGGSQASGPQPYDTGPAASGGEQAVQAVPDRTGGPDAYGYVFADDRDPGGPPYSWQPATNRIADNAWVLVRSEQQTDPWDDGVVTTTLPFVFNFYGVGYTTLHIATNGNAHFGPPNDWWPQAGGQPCLPSTSRYVPAGIVSPLWFDFVVPRVPTDTGGVYTDVVGTAPNRAFIVEWRNVYRYGDLNTRATFELLLYEDGSIIFQYQSLNGVGVDGSGGVVGIQNASGTIGLPYSCYQSAVAGGRAIRYRVRQAAIFTPPTAQKGGAPGATLVYTQTLANQTGISNSFIITPTGNTWTTTVEPSNTGMMPHGSSIPVIVRVQIPPDAPLGSTDTATINVSSTLPAPGTYTATAVLTSSVSTYGVDFVPPTSTRGGDYGSPVTHTLTIYNRSGQDNYFRLDIEGNQWATSISPTQTTTLPPDGSTLVEVVVQVPADSSLGASDVVTVTAVGQLPDPGTYFGVTTITTTAGVWQRKSPMPLARSRGAAVAFPPNGRIYVLGGEYNNGDTNLPVEEYDPVYNAWVQRAPLQVGVSNVGAAVIGNAIYIPGGYNQSSGTQRTLQVYYPLEDRSAVIATDPLPAPRLGAGVAAYNGKLYVIGGSTDGVAATNTVYEYDPARPAGSRWQARASMPTPRFYMGAATVDGLIYAVGGMSSQRVELNTVEVYDPAADTWSTRSPMSMGRAGLAVVGVNSSEAGCGGYLYAIAGGWFGYTATAERYAPASNNWSPISAVNVARRSLAAAYSPATYSLVAVGGWDGHYETINEAVRCSGTLVPPTPGPTWTPAPTPSPTPTACTISFSDVPTTHPFYPYIRCLACRGIVGGYSDGTFRPDNFVTRGQLSKIVANAAGFSEPVSGQTFSDVPPSHPFYVYIERMAGRGIIGGYSDSTFRPDNNATRGQISKIVANSASIQDPIPSNRQTFVDVPPTHPFWVYIERLAGRGILGGYSDGTFRPDNNATRGQTAKIVSNAFFPQCGTP